jgi:hypothetical protein
LIPFLIIVSWLLLLLSVISLIQTCKQKPEGLFAELEQEGFGNVILQIAYGLTGFYLLYVLTVMNHVRPLTWFGILTILEMLLFLLALRGDRKTGPLVRWYRNGIGMYVSALINIAFPIAAIYFLQFSS